MNVAKKETKRRKGKSSKRPVDRKQTNAVQRFFRETMGELRKVTWPSREEALNLTRIVLIVMVIMGAFLGSLDYLFLKLFQLIL
jgi:preprotein translocase subunit SecE